MEGFNTRRLIPVLVILAFIAGCAKISTPSGGPKDYDPPVVLKTEPVPGTRNFRGKEISVTFDEYVVLDQIDQKFMVSPPMKKKPKIVIRGKSIIVKYDEPLRDSTTYTFNFQDAIRDLNQGNILNNFQFVFSTGPQIDSLSVTGNVYNALTLDAPVETLILLYNELADSAVVKHIPAYVSRADKKGYFRIDNVKKGKYKLYALKDADNSKNFNLPDEEFAFLDSVITVTPERNFLPIVKDTATVKVKAVKPTGKAAPDTIVIKGRYSLFLFKPPMKVHYLAGSSRPSQYKLQYNLSLPPDSSPFTFSIPGASEKSYNVERSKNNDTLLVWLSDTALINNQFIKSYIVYPFTDSTGKIINRGDSISMRFALPRSTRARKKASPFTFTSPLFTGALKPGQKVILQSQTPFWKTDTSKLRFYEITGKERTKIPFTLTPDTLNSCRMLMNVKLTPGKNYQFIADSASFRSRYGEVSDSVGYRVGLKSSDMYGNLTFFLTGYTGSRIIQLLTKEEKLVRETRMARDGKVEFANIDRGSYRARVIYDLNGDGKWTTGDFAKRLQPEPASYLPKELEVRENWDDKEEWNITQQNVKKIKSTGSKSPGR